MSIEKIKEILKNRKVQVIAGTVAGVLVLTLFATKILNNSIIESKNIITEKIDKKDVSEESKEIQEQLEELKNIESNLSGEEKNELEDNIVDIENNDDRVAIYQEDDNDSISNSNRSSTTTTNSSTSTNANKGSSKTSSESSSNLNSSNNNVTSNSGSTAGNTDNKEEVHTHNWVAITSTINNAEQGHYENILVSAAWTEEVPVYEEKEVAICNGCGSDITSDPWEHIEQQALAGNYSCGGFHTDWKKVQVGTNKINHDAVYENKWVVDKAAWVETVTTGYKCNACGATK